MSWIQCESELIVKSNSDNATPYHQVVVYPVIRLGLGTVLEKYVPMYEASFLPPP